MALEPCPYDVREELILRVVEVTVDDAPVAAGRGAGSLRCLAPSLAMSAAAFIALFVSGCGGFPYFAGPCDEQQFVETYTRDGMRYRAVYRVDSPIYR